MLLSLSYLVSLVKSL
jgi:hypothetical protein